MTPAPRRPDPILAECAVVFSGGGRDTVLETETILPCQFAALRDTKPDKPELRLAAAVLLDAVETIRRGPQGYVNPYYATYDETVAWVRDEQPGYVFSFVSICGAFGIDPQAARRALLTRPGARRAGS